MRKEIEELIEDSERRRVRRNQQLENKKTEFNGNYKDCLHDFFELQYELSISSYLKGNIDILDDMIISLKKILEKDKEEK